MNEEHGGRFPANGRHAPSRRHVMGGETHAAFPLSRCPLCKETNRTVQVFADDKATDLAYYAACGNCGHWERL